MQDITTSVRFLLGGAMLAGAVAFDLRERRVPNPWWVPFAALAAVLLLGDALQAPDLAVLGMRCALALAVGGGAYLLWRLHLFGGADAKALMVLAALAPLPPAAAPYALQPALDALVNGAALMCLLPLVFLAANLARGRLVLPAALLGTPRPLEEARRRFVWPMQVADPQAPGGLRWRYWQRIGGDLPAEYHALERQGVREVWVTPKVPFLLPLGVGWALAWWRGDLLLELYARLGLGLSVS